MQLFCKMYLDMDGSVRDVNQLVRTILDGKSEDDAMISTSVCSIYIDENDEFDEVMRTTPADGFLYYRYFLDIEPVDGVIRGSYVQALSHLLRGLRKNGCKVVPACDFEDELPKALCPLRNYGDF